MNKPKMSVSVHEAEQWKARVYFFIDNETLFENLVNRRNRPIREYRALLPTALGAAGFDPSLASNARWSQKAGCSCGCSPGFIIDHAAMRYRDVFVTLK